ncbi:unnamed protein product, partial [Urochloa humidicola]
PPQPPLSLPLPPPPPHPPPPRHRRRPILLHIEASPVAAFATAATPSPRHCRRRRILLHIEAFPRRRIRRRRNPLSSPPPPPHPPPRRRHLIVIAAHPARSRRCGALGRGLRRRSGRAGLADQHRILLLDLCLFLGQHIFWPDAPPVFPAREYASAVDPGGAELMRPPDLRDPSWRIGNASVLARLSFSPSPPLPPLSSLSPLRQIDPHRRPRSILRGMQGNARKRAVHPDLNRSRE